MSLIHVHNLAIDFRLSSSTIRAVDGVSFSIGEGDALCLVGESGSGKSATALSLAKLLPSPPALYPSGEVLIGGQNVLKMEKRQLRQVRGGVVSYVFQEPSSSLNPVLTVGYQIKETLRLHRPDAAGDQEVLALLKQVGIAAAESRLRDYPHQLSGGMLQRVMIAMAIASRPKLLVADEPTTALDVTIQAQILDLLAHLKKSLGMSLLLITHNLAIVKEVADRVMVMYAGQIVEEGPAPDVLRTPLHPYTQALLKSVPKLGSSATRLDQIPGAPPKTGDFPSGCRFHPRCPIARPDCAAQMPELRLAATDRRVRCPYASEQA